MITFFKNKDGSAVGLNITEVKHIYIPNADTGGRSTVTWKDGSITEMDLDLSQVADEEEKATPSFDLDTLMGQVQ